MKTTEGDPRPTPDERGTGRDGHDPSPSHRFARRYAAVVVKLRWLVLVTVGGAVFASVALLPSLSSQAGGLESGLVGVDEPAIRAQVEAVRRFGLPLLTRTAVVQHDPAGLNLYTQARVLLRAAEVNKQTLTGAPDGSLALPVLSVPGPDGRPTTTAVTYVFTDPGAGFGAQVRAAREYAARIDRPDDHLLGVTGTVPVQLEQGRLVQDRLHWLEIGSVLAVAVIVGVTFRSVLAPVITLLTAGAGYLVADRLVGYGAELMGFSAPGQLQPVLVALILGISTDYAIFFLSGTDYRLREGEDAHTAARGAVTEYLTTVLIAGLTVGAGVLALVVARTGIFQAFGPGLAVTVFAGLFVSITLVPALLAVFGRFVFWPRRYPANAGDPPAAAAAEPVRTRQGSWVVRLTSRRWRAGALAAGVIGALLAASAPLLHVNDAVSPVDALPPGNPVRQATEAAAVGFSPGVLSPTAVILSRQAIADDPRALRRFQDLLAAQAGVSRVLGPATLSDPLQRLESQLEQLVDARLFIGPAGQTVRYLVVFDSDPLGADAVDDLRELERRMPALLAQAGIPDVEVAYAGDTALGLSLADSARSDVVRVAVLVALVDLVLLVLFLRALVAPLYLLACSVLAVGAALGLTTLLFQDVFGQSGLIFYVPFAAGVLLVSLGSDYNIFGVGHIWDTARTRPLPEALAHAVPRSNRAITSAGIALAASFAFVALVPVAPFQQLAFAVAVGVLLDAFVVRAFLVPALISLVGRASGWPGPRLRVNQPQREDRGAGG